MPATTPKTVTWNLTHTLSALADEAVAVNGYTVLVLILSTAIEAPRTGPAAPAVFAHELIHGGGSGTPTTVM